MAVLESNGSITRCEWEHKIHRLESQVKELEQQRDEAGRRYIAQVQECTDKQRWIDQLESAARHASEEGEKDAATIAHLRECLKRLEWCDKWGSESSDDCCPACGGLRPREDNGYSHLADIGHASDCWLAAAIKEGE